MRGAPSLSLEPITGVAVQLDSAVPAARDCAGDDADRDAEVQSALAELDPAQWQV